MPKSDAGRDGIGRDASADAARHDAGVDRHDGGVDRHDDSLDRHDARTDGHDGGRVCTPYDVSTWCPGGSAGAAAPLGCQPTWADALATPTCIWAGAPFADELRGDCGQYHVRQVFWNENGASYTYDISTGALVAINGCPLGSLTSCGCSGPASLPTYGQAACSGDAFTPICTYDGGVAGSGDGGSCLAGQASNGFSWNAPCPRDGGTDAGTACYASCTESFYGTFRYVGCVSASSVGSMCYPSCAECP